MAKLGSPYFGENMGRRYAFQNFAYGKTVPRKT